jgi:phenylacetaldehyde dehydrogenase
MARSIRRCRSAGFKQSGWGREKGREVLELYTEVKSVAMAL